MKIYLLTQNKIKGYDTYDACIVAAETEEQAKTFDPYMGTIPQDDWNEYSAAWVNDPSDVTAEEIGICTNPNQLAGVILASFNAG